MKKKLILITVVLAVGVGSFFWFNVQAEDNARLETISRNAKSIEDEIVKKKKAPKTLLLEINSDRLVSAGPDTEIKVYSDSTYTLERQLIPGKFKKSGTLNSDLIDEIRNEIASSLEVIERLPVPKCALKVGRLPFLYEYVFYESGEKHWFDSCLVNAFSDQRLFELTSALKQAIFNDAEVSDAQSLYQRPILWRTDSLTISPFLVLTPSLSPSVFSIAVSKSFIAKATMKGKVALVSANVEV